MNITAIILDGRHGGTMFTTDYQAVIKLPIKKEMISIGEKYDSSIREGDIEEYQEIFMSVDKKTVLYSTDDVSPRIHEFFRRHCLPTYPIRLF